MAELADLLLQDLNPAQRDAVTAPDGPLLVFAGAGSGKTRVLTRRIAYLLAVRGVDPSEVLAVTFTNKAARLMLDRVTDSIGPRAGAMWIQTFHSACVRILRSHAGHVGRKSGFSIYDDVDQQTLLKELMPDCDLDPQEWPPRQIASLLDRAKNDAVDPVTLAEEMPTAVRESVARLLKLYGERVAAANAFDFGDLIVETIRLLQENPEVREGYRRRFRYILVDEFQDTNRAQYLLLEQLLGEHRNLTVVGDDDQSIYRWRGARIGNILEFEASHAGARVVVLGTNYRSTGMILRAADAVIRQNVRRHPKVMDTPNPDGEPLVRYRADNEYDEARFVVATIADLRLRHGLRAAEIAVFFRVNAQSRIIEEILIERGMPYAVVGGMRFYDRKEIKDALAYLRLLVNPADSVAFDRVVNVPGRGVGDKTLARLKELATKDRLTPVAAAARIGGGEGDKFGGKVREELAKLARALGEEEPSLFAERPSQRAVRLLREVGYIDMLERSGKIEDRSRLENVQEFFKSIEDWEKEAGADADLTLFLEKVSLLSDVDTYDDRADAVSLMTLHTAKGLEFPAVMMVGMEEGLLPHARSLQDDHELEEERRLCYVGITRAKRWLYWSAAAMRRTYGGAPSPTRVSRFWHDLPPDAVMDYGRAAPTTWGARPVAPVDPGEPVYDYSDSQDPDDMGGLALGARVRHSQFGVGTVLGLRGSGAFVRADIHFDRAGVKTMMVAHARLEVVGPGR